MPPALTIAGGQITSMPPDVCKTPTPVGAIPTPYDNLAEPPMGFPVTENIFVAGVPACTKETKFMPSQGDEPGVAMGIASGQIMGKVEVVMGSMTVKLEGQPAIFQGLPTTHNNNNTIGSIALCGQFNVSING